MRPSAQSTSSSASSAAKRELDIGLTYTRLYLGRGCTQLQAEILGKRLVQVLSTRKPEADAYHRRHDKVILLNRRPLARLQPTPDGPPAVLWNLPGVLTAGLEKQALLDDLARATPPGVGEVAPMRAP